MPAGVLLNLLAQPLQPQGKLPAELGSGFLLAKHSQEHQVALVNHQGVYAFVLLGEQLAQQGPQGALGEKGALLAVVQAVYVQVPRDKLGARQADRAVFQVPLEGRRVDALPQEQPPQHLPVGLAANVLFLFMVVSLG